MKHSAPGQPPTCTAVAIRWVWDRTWTQSRRWTLPLIMACSTCGCVASSQSRAPASPAAPTQPSRSPTLSMTGSQSLIMVSVSLFFQRRLSFIIKRTKLRSNLLLSIFIQAVLMENGVFAGFYIFYHLKQWKLLLDMFIHCCFYSNIPRKNLSG